MAATILQAWHRTVRRDPAAVALAETNGGQRWTRAQLAAAAVAWAARLPDRSALARRRVAMGLANGPAWWEAFLGLLELDAVPVLLDASENLTRQREIAASAKAVGLWTESGWIPLGRSRVRESAETGLVKLTSGSTGRPRVWPFTHVQMLADGRQICHSMGIGPEDVNLAVIPLGHSYGLGNLVMPLLAQGTRLVLVDSPLPHVLVAVIARARPTVFPAVPALLDGLVRSSLEPGRLAGLRLVISAGAALPPALAAAFADKFGLVVHNFYGASETGGICYDRSGEATRTGRSVGLPMTGVRLHWGRGRRFHVTSAAVGGRGRFSPADLGRLNEQGELVLLGRAGRLTKIGARRVDLGEIEVAVKSLKGVRDACVAVSTTGRQIMAAAVVTDLTKSEVKAGLAAVLPAWKRPGSIAIVGALPVTARGKIDRAALAALLFGPGAGAAPGAAE